MAMMKLRSPPCNKDLRPFDPDPYSFVFHCSSVSCAPNQNNDRISSDASHTWRKLHKSNNVLNLSCPKRSLYEMSVGMRCVATVWVLLIKIIIFFWRLSTLENEVIRAFCFMCVILNVTLATYRKANGSTK